MNKKKSKCCCIYVKPKKFGESDSEDDSDKVAFTKSIVLLEASFVFTVHTLQAILASKVLKEEFNFSYCLCKQKPESYFFNLLQDCENCSGHVERRQH